MSPTPQTFKPPVRPLDCCDWITAEDVCRHALAAFYLARDSMKPPAGERFTGPDGLSWADRETFGDNLALLFDMRIKTDGYQLGVHPGWASEARMLQRWKAPAPASWDGGSPPWKRSETDPELSSSHTLADPAGSAPDAGNGPQSSPNRPGAP